MADGKESKLNAIVKKVISDQSKLEDAISQLSLAQVPVAVSVAVYVARTLPADPLCCVTWCCVTWCCVTDSVLLGSSFRGRGRALSLTGDRNVTADASAPRIRRECGE